MLLSVVVGVELANLDGRRSCQTASWMRTVVVLNMAGCRGSVALMSCCCAAVLGVSEVAMGSAIESPLLPFQRDVVLFNVILFEVCPQPATTPRQHREGPTAIFSQISFVYGGESRFWFGYLPILDGIQKYACQTLCFKPLFSLF